MHALPKRVGFRGGILFDIFDQYDFWTVIATIVNIQWFSRPPLPLNEWFGSNHRYQWFLQWFFVYLPLVPMVFLTGNHWARWFCDGFWSGNHWTQWFFNGCQPLVQRCDGNDTSFRSTTRVLDKGGQGVKLIE